MNAYSSFSELSALGKANTKGTDYCVHNSASNPSQKSFAHEDFLEFERMLEDGTLSGLVEEEIMKQFSKVLNSTSSDLAGQVRKILLDQLSKNRKLNPTA